MSDAMMGEIRMFAGNFAPRGWALCNGQLLSINQYSALFSILGTTYGGDGRTTFGLPDLRGRSPVHAGQGPGLPIWNLGAASGPPQHELPAASATTGAGMTAPATAGTIPTVSPSLAVHFIIALEGFYPPRP
jgi:microcystin-dependent protein